MRMVLAMTRREIPAAFDSFLRLQGLCGAIVLASWLIFWAVENPVRDVGNLFIYVLTQVNLTVVLLYPFRFLYEDRRVRYHWPFHLISIVAINGVVVVTSAAVIYRVDGLSLPFVRFLHQSWKFPFVANLLFAFPYEAYKITTSRLRRHNQQLQREIEVETAEREIEAEELKRAQEIQLGLLPKEIPQLADFAIAGAWAPARVVGGDYYDVIRLSKQKVALCIADVAGKGVSAALLMANVQAAVRAFGSEDAPPSLVCKHTNSALCANTAADKFVTMFYGVLDAATSTLTYANAGHPPPILLRNGGRVIHLDTGGALLGVIPGWRYEDAVLQLQPGDLLVLFTDGITEAVRPDGQEFGEDRMISAILESGKHSPSELQSDLFRQIKTFCNAPLSDDATLIVVARAPLASEKEHVTSNHGTEGEVHAGVSS